MYLKALEIQGFKSFPDKTVLNFGEDITAIVGPNGSGKSNISDAIRWVMGEQSVKGLRGTKMEDVIFGGTEKRAQVGFAQVTLILDNTEHVFPSMEETEVAVTRRYYRSGESEYFINKQSVRLKDVTELFMDTGMGKEGYSIIGQGRIDEILSTRSTDRRDIFEEAAGISKFRHRKEEAERKLERTEENLQRINDKIAELELQVEPLREQSETAKKYLVLRDELRLLEVSVWLTNLEQLKGGVQKLQSDFAAAQQQRDEARAALDALYAEGEQCGERMQEKDMEAERVRGEAGELDAKAAEEDSAIAVLETTVAHHRETIARLQSEQSETDQRAGTLEAQAREQDEQSAECASRIDALNAELQELLALAAEAAERVGGAQSEAEALRAKEALAVAAAADERAKLAALEAEDAQAEARRVAAEKDRDSAREQLAEKEQEAKANRRALEDAQDEATAIANIISGHTLRMDERKKKADAATDERVKRTMEAHALEDRIRLLTEMEKDYEGFQKAVKTVCQAQNSLRGIHGPVAGLLRTDAKVSLAIEIALGAGLQNIVVDREEDAKSAIQFLKQRDAGRATFLPLTAIRGEELKEKGLESENGFVGVASRLIRFDKQYQNIFYNLLGRTVVVEDLDSGIAMARRHQNAFRIVTLDGQVLNRGGSMTGGSVSRSAGVISRSVELETLRAKTEETQRKLEEAKTREESAQRELTAAAYELETAQSQQRAAEDEVLRHAQRQDHYDILLTALRGNEETLTAEIASIDARRKAIAEEKSAAEAAREESDRKAEEFRAAAEAAASGQSDLLSRSGELAEAITAKKEELAGITANRLAAETRAADLRRLAQELSGDRALKAASVSEYEAEVERSLAEIEGHKAALAEIGAQSGALRERLAAISEEKIALEAERTAKTRASQEKNEDLLNFERAASKLESKLATSAMEEKQILDKLWDTYELSHSAAEAIRTELESVPKANRRVAELKREISSLGTINVGAIEEFERVNTRYTYLTDQRDDVSRAREDLNGIIEEITGQMTVIFKEQFALLSESFETTFAELFGGGRAKLELEDETDVLNCGIEIKAQPPGKTLKTISLLSGGEKAFVAIALYFSILKVHPTPFCVMDEIEAALDEANVVRFARYMRNLSGRTQFIVITHRRGTMEEADILYGVTMQEQGVSKILTINLNDMAKELKIK